MKKMASGTTLVLFWLGKENNMGKQNETLTYLLKFITRNTSKDLENCEFE